MANAQRKQPPSAAGSDAPASQGAGNPGEQPPATEGAGENPPPNEPPAKAKDAAKTEEKKVEALPRPGEPALVKKTGRKFVGGTGNLNSFRKEQACSTYTIYPQPGDTVEDVLDPSYFAHVAKKLPQGTRIEFVFLGEDPRFLDTLVAASGEQWVKLKVITNVSFAAEAQEALGLSYLEKEGSYRVMYHGPMLKWCVQRVKDQAIIRKELEDEAAANKWLENYKRALRK